MTSSDSGTWSSSIAVVEVKVDRPLRLDRQELEQLREIIDEALA